MKPITRWEFYKKNYIPVTVGMVGLFLLTLIIELLRGSSDWWFSFFFLLIALIIPIGSNISYRKKFKKW